MKIVKKKEEICFPEEGCVKSFQQHSSLEKHLDCGKHQYALEQQTLYDKAVTMHATKLERGAGVLPEIVDEGQCTYVSGRWWLRATDGMGS